MQLISVALDIVIYHIKKEIPNNKFIGEIDFMEPLKNNKEEDVRKAIMWVKELIG